MKTIRHILGKIKKADEEYSLINKGDKIALGLSGGKDSMALLYCLHLYNKYSKKNFKIYPMIIDLGFPAFNVTKINEYVASLGYKLDIIDHQDAYKILSDHREHDLLPCSICAKMKKSMIDNYAKERGITKIAFAHHIDDALETLLMNMIYGGRIATFSPYMHLDKDDVDFIRPFIYVKEHEIATLVKEENIYIEKSACPNDKLTTRENIKNILKNIYRGYPIAKLNFAKMLTDDVHLDLWFNLKKIAIKNTPLYLKKIIFAKEMIAYQNFYQKHHLGKLPTNQEVINFYGIYNKRNILQGSFYLAINKKEKIIVSKKPFLLPAIKKYHDNIMDFYDDLILKNYSSYNFKKK